jgi:hypothetical protein
MTNNLSKLLHFTSYILLDFNNPDLRTSIDSLRLV